jgi:hypothetical protein
MSIKRHPHTVDLRKMRHKRNLHGVRSIVRRISSRIDRIIRSRKTIAIGFAGSLMLSQLCLSCKDTSKSDYTVKTMGSCHRQTSIRIIDESNGIVSAGRFLFTSQNPQFKNYVNTISQYVFAKIDKMGHCQGNLPEDRLPQVELVFVYRPLISQGIAPFNFEQTKSPQTQYLDSPWVKLTIDKLPKPMVRAAFIWNDRQFLLDQALLSGARADPSKPLLPIDRDTYKKFVEDYYESVEMAPLREAFAENSNSAENMTRRLEESQAAALSQISQRLPADIIWLSRHIRFGGDPPVGHNRMDETINQEITAYINLSKVLIDIRFSSIQTNQNYQSIFDLKDVLNINKYRINKLH